jgi:hypothetical protein
LEKEKERRENDQYVALVFIFPNGGCDKRGGVVVVDGVVVVVDGIIGRRSDLVEGYRDLGRTQPVTLSLVLELYNVKGHHADIEGRYTMDYRQSFLGTGRYQIVLGICGGGVLRWNRTGKLGMSLRATSECSTLFEIGTRVMTQA